MDYINIINFLHVSTYNNNNTFMVKQPLYSTKLFIDFYYLYFL